MKASQFGKLIAAIRKEQRWTDGNLLTQTQLGQITGLGEVTIRNIERGKRTCISFDQLSRIADALQLTSREKQEFYSLSVFTDNEKSPSPKNDLLALEQLTTLLENIEQPAFICDSFGNVITLNLAMVFLYDMSLEMFAIGNPITRFNIMRLVFAPEFSKQREGMGVDFFKRFTLYSLVTFKVISLKNRGTAKFERLLKALKEYPDFKSSWEKMSYYYTEDVVISSSYMNVQHPEKGSLQFASSQVVGHTSFDTIYMFIFSALSENTNKAVQDFMSSGGSKVLSLIPNWPSEPTQRN